MQNTCAWIRRRAHKNTHRAAGNEPAALLFVFAEQLLRCGEVSGEIGIAINLQVCYNAVSVS